MRDMKQNNRDSEVIYKPCNRCSTDNRSKSRKVSVASINHTGVKFDHKLCNCEQTEQDLPKSILKNTVRPVSERSVPKVYAAIYPSPLQSQQNWGSSKNTEVRIPTDDPSIDPGTEKAPYQSIYTNFRSGQTTKYFFTVTVVFALLCVLLLTNDTYGVPYFLLLLFVYLLILCFLA